MGSRIRVWKRWTWEVVLVVVLALALSSTSAASKDLICPRLSITDSIFGVGDGKPGFHSANSLASVCVNEGGEVALWKALDLIYSGSLENVAVLFYAAWCPFSTALKPKFPLLASLYPSIPHIAVEESAIRPSTLSKYGVHGFPTLLLMNSTMRVHYHGSRSFSSLVTFYNDVTGVLPDDASISKIWYPLTLGKHDIIDPESCPFSWARSPEKLLMQETYLALASAFLLVRFLYLLLPSLVAFAQLVWRWQVSHARIKPRVFMTDVVQAFKCLVKPCKTSNLQEGAMHAGAWASKSLVTVARAGEASTSGTAQKS
ncbi:5'-adenylylsulfate reductase-like 4 [Linum grandiflorum]